MAEKIILDFELNTSGSQRSIKELNDRIKDLNNQLKGTDIGSKAFNDLNRELAKTKVQAQNLQKDFKDITLEIKIDDAGGVNTIETLRNRLALLKSQLAKEEIGSEAFKSLSKEIAGINIQIRELNQELKGLDFGQTLSQMGNVLAGIAGSVGLLNDAFMDGNDETQKYIENATRTIMAIQGIGAVVSGADSAMKLLNMTMAKNPLMVWVAAATALIAVGGLLVKQIMANNSAMNDTNRLTKEQKELVKSLNTEYTRYRLELAQLNGDLRLQIRLTNELLKLDYAEKIEDIAEKFNLEASEVRQVTNAYKEYQANQAESIRLGNLYEETQEKLKTATGSQKTALESLLSSTRTELVSLANRNIALNNLYNKNKEFYTLYTTVSQLELQLNSQTKKSYEDKFETILKEGSAAYSELADEYKQLADTLKNFDKEIISKRVELEKDALDQKIIESIKAGDIIKTIQLGEQKLQLEINEKKREYNEYQKNISDADKESMKRIDELNKKNKKAQEDYYDFSVRRFQLENEYNQLIQSGSDEDKKSAERKKEELKILENTIETKKKETAENLKIIESEKNKSGLIRRNLQNLEDELKALQDKSKRDIQEYIDDIYRNVMDRSASIESQINATSLKIFELFLNDREDIINASEDKKKELVLKASIETLTEERKQLINFYQDSLELYEAFSNQKGSIFRNTISQELTDIGDLELKNFNKTIDDIYTKLTAKYNEMEDMKFKAAAEGNEKNYMALELQLEDLNKQKITLEELKQSTDIMVRLNDDLLTLKAAQSAFHGENVDFTEKEMIMLSDIVSKREANIKLSQYENDLFERYLLNSIELVSSEEELNMLREEAIKTIPIYDNLMRKTNDAQRAATERQIQDSVTLLNVERDRVNALIQLEIVKLNRYEGYINKTIELTENRLDHEEKLAIIAANELFEKKIIDETEYQQYVLDIQADFARKRQENELTALKSYIQIAEQLYGGLFDFIGNRQQQNLTNQLNNLTTETERSVESEREKADNGLITQEQYLRNKEQLQYEAEQKRRQLEQDQAKRDRQIAVFEATLGMITGIAKAIPNPFQMALAGVTGAAQIAAASSTPLPQFEYGGVISGKRHKDGGTIIEAEKDEIILKRGVRANPMLNNMASMINESVGGKSFRLPMNNVSSMNNEISDFRDKNMVDSIVNGINTIKVINVATETEKVNKKVTKLQNKAKL
jgi:hypothetical protein